MRIKKRFKRWLARLLQNELAMYVPVGEVRVIKERPKTTIYRNVEIVNNSFFKGNEERVIDDVLNKFSTDVIKKAGTTKVVELEPWENQNHIDGSKIVTTIEIVDRKF